MTEVRNVIGHGIHPEEPLMSAGLDSRGGMELRRSLAQALSMQLPVTLLYDYQSINDIVNYVNSTILAAGAATAGGGEDKGEVESGVASDHERADDYDSDFDGTLHRPVRRQPDSTAPMIQQKVSKLFKTLRPPQHDRPLFLAAPGVANAQSAYFSFSMFLQWSTQPIYVLDKDNDLNLRDLALQNARDIVASQSDGPYLVGGHSYGGAVAVEIAMVLESWGKEVGLVLVSILRLFEEALVVYDPQVYMRIPLKPDLVYVASFRLWIPHSKIRSALGSPRQLKPRMKIALN